jgi:pyruvate dehydrogenase E2 component (dihydrolipoamide acetyltransferase)
MALREVRLPALTTTMQEAELVEWRVEVGDEVHEGQPLGEVVTDKVDMELESPFDGTVSELLVEAGSVVTVGTVIARVDTASVDLRGGLGLDDDEGGAGERSLAGGRGAGGEGERERAGGRGAGGEGERERAGGRGAEGEQDPAQVRVPAPPPVRIRAREAGVDLADVTPTGRRGQVTTDDLRRHIEAGAGATRATASTEGEGERERAGGRGAGGSGASPSGRSPVAATGDRRRAALRAATARVVTRSATIPQFTLHRAIDLSRAVQRKNGRSWTTEIIRALAAALREHPQLNGRWNDEEQRADTTDVVRIGLAVDVAAGLLVVGLDDPDQITPTHADEHVRQIVGRARDGKVDSSDVEGITFTVSNLGGLGVDAFDALLMPPQAGILSVGRVVERPVVVDGHIRPRLQVDVGLTVDHRVADGADGARLLETFATILEAA